jgi:hypothetical protein
VAGASGFRQFIGLILSLVVFLAVWAVVHKFVLKDSALGVVVACAVAVVAFPIAVRLGFLLTGGKIHRPGSH